MRRLLPLLISTVLLSAQAPPDGAACSVAATRVEPTHRVIDDRDSLSDGVVLRLTEIDRGSYADQVELGPRRHLVDDFRNGSAMGRPRC